jgi:hypothetical protein
MFGTSTYPINQVFGPKFNKEGCSLLQELKNKFCDKQHSSSSCTSTMNDKKLKRIHDEAMKCRNIRALCIEPRIKRSSNDD